jgi:hypothetical protein
MSFHQQIPLDKRSQIKCERRSALKLSEPDDKNKYYARRLFIFMGTETAALVQARKRVNRIIPGEIANFDKLTFNTPF